MKVSKVAQSTARRIFRLCSKDGQVNEEHLRIAVTKLAEEKPRDYRGMLQALRRWLNLDGGWVVSSNDFCESWQPVFFTGG